MSEAIAGRDARLGWVAFFSRWMLGLLFGMAGWAKVFRMGPVQHARELFVEPYVETWIPTPVLWTLGTAIPVFELASGVLLLVGLQTRRVTLGLGVLLLVVTYGHLLLEPFFDITTHVFPRLVLVLLILTFHEHDRLRLETRARAA